MKPKAQVFTETDGFGDWRTLAASTLGADFVSPAGIKHTAGTNLFFALNFDMPERRNFTIIPPHAAALALNASLRASGNAERHWAEVKITDIRASDRGAGTQVPEESRQSLYDYLEECIVSATTAFQAIEAFSNVLIGRAPAQEFEIVKNNKLRKFNNFDAQRWVSTEQKLDKILPVITGVGSIKRTKHWSYFKSLKRVRDDVIHFKHDDQYPEPFKPAEDSLFKSVMGAKVRSYATAAARVILYYSPETDDRWIKHVRAVFPELAL